MFMGSTVAFISVMVFMNCNRNKSQGQKHMYLCIKLCIWDTKNC